MMVSKTLRSVDVTSKDLAEDIKTLQKSEHFLPPDLLQEWARRLIISNNIHIKISALKHEPGYLATEEIDKLAMELKALENVGNSKK